MKVFILSLILFTSIASQASVRVMTFNTTCATFCEGKKWDKFKYRKHWIVDTIKRNSPDIIGMQEVFFPHQLKWFKRQLKDYHLIFARKFYIFKYADPALFIRKSRFSIKKWGGFWLGPLGYWFSFGWRAAIPRRVQWTRLLDHETDLQFYFASAHFDNNSKNKTKASKVFTKAFKKVKLPVIFAADTNLRTNMQGYKNLTEYFLNSFDLKENLEFVRNSDTTPDDSCNLSKGTIFPECMVDHIFLSKGHRWQVTNWGIDQFRYGKKNRFSSDHRALFADIEFN